jgi:hypothetical protein
VRLQRSEGVRRQVYWDGPHRRRPGNDWRHHVGKHDHGEKRCFVNPERIALSSSTCSTPHQRNLKRLFVIDDGGKLRQSYSAYDKRVAGGNFRCSGIQASHCARSAGLISGPRIRRPDWQGGRRSRANCYWRFTYNRGATRVRDDFYEEALIGRCSKIEFFGRLASAADACLLERPGASAHVVCAAVLREAYAIVQQMDESELDFTILAEGNQIGDDRTPPGQRIGYSSIRETISFFRGKAIHIHGTVILREVCLATSWRIVITCFCQLISSHLKS